MAVLHVWLAVLAATAAWGQRVHFDKAKPGSLPRGWKVAMTHEGGAPRWETVTDPSAPSRPNVLAQLSTDATSGRFPLAIFERASLVNGSISVRFKAVAGDRDQAAGLVWRYQDPDNYYLARANALEDNVVLYKVEQGKRVPVEPKGTPPKTYGVKQRVLKQTWHTLSVSFRETVFVVAFDGNRIMECEDGTFTGSGKTGLWTKADSVTWFDDFRVERK